MELEIGDEFTLTGRTNETVIVTATVVDAADLPPLPAGVQLQGSLYDISLVGPGPHSEPLTIRIYTGDDRVEHTLAHLNDAGGWEYHKVTSLEGWVSHETTDFSPWGVVTDWLGEAVDFVSDALTGKTDPPKDCDLNGGDGVDWVDHTGSPGVALVHFCVRGRDDARIEVVLKSNSDRPVEVFIPNRSAADWVWVEGTSDVAALILSSFLSQKDSVLLGPGREMTVGYSRPLSGVGVPHEFWVDQSNAAIALAYVGDAIGQAGGEGIAALLALCYGLRGYQEGDNDAPLDAFEIALACASDQGLEVLSDGLLEGGINATAEAAINQIAEAWRQKGLELDGRDYTTLVQGWWATSDRWDQALRSTANLKLLVDLSIDLVQIGSVALSGFFGSDEAFVSRIFLTGLCSAPGIALTGNVTGVEEWARMRAGPSVQTAELGQIGAGETVTFFPESLTYDGHLYWWVMAMPPSGSRCGWVAATYISTENGRTVLSGAPVLDYAIPGISFDAPTVGSWTYTPRASRIDPLSALLDDAFGVAYGIEIIRGNIIDDELRATLNYFETEGYDFPKDFYQEIDVPGADRAVQIVATVSGSGDVIWDRLLIEVADVSLEVSTAVYIEDVEDVLMDELWTFVRSIRLARSTFLGAIENDI